MEYWPLAWQLHFYFQGPTTSEFLSANQEFKDQTNLDFQ